MRKKIESNGKVLNTAIDSMNRSSRSQMFFKIGALKNLAIFRFFEKIDNGTKKELKEIIDD